MITAIIRTLVRSARVGLHFFTGIYQIGVLKRQHGKQWYAVKVGRKAIRQWMDKACQIVGLKVYVEGVMPQQNGHLYIANHVSWLDIIAIASVTDCKFLSKDTVRHWPVIGWLTSSVGSLFIRRNNRRAFHTSLQRVQERLQAGDNICIFPEGTTTDGRQVLPFHSGLFQAAIDAGVAVQPMILKYQTRDGIYESHAPYYGRDIFIFHLLRLLSKRETQLSLILKPALPQHVGADRQKLANVLQLRYMRELQVDDIRAEQLLLETS